MREENVADTGVAPAAPLFAPLIPDLRRLAEAYRVDTCEVDAELRVLFLQQMQVAVTALAKAVAIRDGDGVRQSAHSLRGMGGTIGAPEISVVGVELSAASRRDDFERCACLLVATREWLRQSGSGGSGVEAS